MSKPKDVPEPQRRARHLHGLGSSDMIMVAARQDRQRAEIQAKLNAMLDRLQPLARPRSDLLASSVGRLEAPGTAVKPFDDPAPGNREPLVRPETLKTTAAALVAKLDALCIAQDAIAVRHQPGLPGVAVGQVLAVAAAAEQPTGLDSKDASAEPGEPRQGGTDPSLRVQIEGLTARLDRMEAASALAASTLDSLVSSFDEAQKATFAAAKAAAKEEAGALVAREVTPAIAELNGAASHAQEEIHGVLSLLGTCLDRVVGHLQKLEGLGAPAAPAVVPEPQLPFVLADLDLRPASAPPLTSAEPPSVSVDEPAVAADPAPTVPLPGFGRRSRLAALIDFRSGKRAA